MSRMPRCRRPQSFVVPVVLGALVLVGALPAGSTEPRVEQVRGPGGAANRTHSAITSLPWFRRGYRRLHR